MVVEQRDGAALEVLAGTVSVIDVTHVNLDLAAGAWGCSRPAPLHRTARVDDAIRLDAAATS